MKVRKTMQTEAYQTPVCSLMDMKSEGVLCASFGNESFNDDVTNYGDGTDTDGWY